MPAQAVPPDEPAGGPQQTAKKKPRAGRDLPAAIAVGLSIGGVVVVTLVFAPRCWVVLCADRDFGCQP